MATATGLSAGGIRGWEKGGRIGLSSLHTLAQHYSVDPNWIATGEGDRGGGSADLLDGLSSLEQAVQEQGRAIEEIRTALSGDPRWGQVEERLNFLSTHLQRVAIRAQDEDEQGESQQWSPIDLSPGEPTP